VPDTLAVFGPKHPEASKAKLIANPQAAIRQLRGINMLSMLARMELCHAREQRRR
jgi:hypothetical protein